MKLYILTLVTLFSFISCNDEKSSNEIARDNLSIVLLAIGRDLFKANYCEPPQLILEEGKSYNITLEAGKRFWFKFSVELENNRFINKKIRLTVNHSPSSIFRFNSIGCSQPINESSQGVIPKSSSSNQTIYEVSLSGSDVTDSLLLSTGDVNFTINYILF